MFGKGRPHVEVERKPRNRTGNTETKRVPRGTIHRRNKSFLMRHLWYCGWGTAGMAILAKMYERSPEFAKNVLPFYITGWIAGAIAIPPYMAKKPSPPTQKKSNTEEEEVVVEV